MIVHVKPPRRLKGKISLPASKSYSIRAFIIAACGGRSLIKNPSNCDDAKVSIRAARFLGAKIVKIKGVNHFLIRATPGRLGASQINVGESGTVLRFLLPLISLRGGNITVTGEGSLKGRPNRFLINTLQKMGVKISGKGKKQSIPIALKGGELQGGRVSIEGSLSSQFISALLIAAPQLAQDTRLKLTGSKIVSQDYIRMTTEVLQLCGVCVTRKDARTYAVKGNQRFKGLKNFVVPSDYGLAAFLMGAAVLKNSNIILQGHLRDDLIQADGHILRLLRKMGVKFERTTKSIKIKGPFSLKSGTFSLKDCPDLVPIMTVLALFAKGKTRLTDIRHARVKESDRIGDLKKELVKIGAKIKDSANEMTIIPQDEYRDGQILDPHNDHRLAMAFCVLGIKIPVVVKDMECCAKSYPDFLKDYQKLGGHALRR